MHHVGSFRGSVSRLFVCLEKHMHPLIINGNPKPGSLCSAIASEISDRVGGYLINVKDMDMSLTYAADMPENADIALSKDKLSGAREMIFVLPVWWGSYPAAMKAWFDRVLTAGFAFTYNKGSQIPVQLLKGKSADLILTMDSPWWYYLFLKKKNLENNLRYDILGFCGISLNRIHKICNVRSKNRDQLSI